MLTRATETLIEQSLLYPGGFISPLEIEDAVTRALAEDLGRAGDVTSIATDPARHAEPHRAGGAQGRHHRRPAAGRGLLPQARPTSRSGRRPATATVSPPRPC